MSQDILDLNGRIGLVTGAGQGVGRQIALHFAGHGAGGVVVNDVSLERAEAVAKEAEGLGCRALPVTADVTDRDAVNDMVGRATAELGAVDVLVNNAGNMGADPGRVERKPFWEASVDSWDAFIGVNLYGVLNCASAVIPGMIERAQGGRLITVISDAGRVGEARLAAYSAAKSGAAGFVRAIAREAGKFGITSNAISLSTLEPPFDEEAMAEFLANERVKEQLSRYVIRRFGKPDDVANMVLFLCSGAASWITGQTYPVNGGYSFAQ